MTEFKKHGFKVFEYHNTDRLKVEGFKGQYMNVFLHNKRDEKYTKEGDVLIDKFGNRQEMCRMCGSLHNLRYVVPYDGSAPAGTYCYYCRRKHSIMDVEDAKRYNKIL